MNLQRNSRVRSPLRIAAAALAATVLALVGALMVATPAQAEGPVGYVRLAHLSPDTPKVDVYLSKVGDTSPPQVFEHVGYGIMTSYMPLPVGTYAVAMRTEGADPASPPVLTTQVTVAEGAAYTVAGVGKFAGLGLTVLTDDLSRPAAGQAKVRVIQASVNAPVLDVELTDGTPVAKGATFASTTPYRTVNPGTWTLRLRPNGSSVATTLGADLAAGSVYSLLVLDGPSGLALQLRADARGGASAPDGGVDAGGGGSSPWYPLPVIAVGVVLVAALGIFAARMRRMASARSERSEPRSREAKASRASARSERSEPRSREAKAGRASADRAGARSTRVTAGTTGRVDTGQ